MIKTVPHVLTALALGGLSFTGLAPEAEARSQGAVLGKSNWGSNTTCFGETWGGVSQNCSGVRNWTIPLVYDNAGDKTIRISAQGSRPNDIRCRGYSVNSSGNDARVAHARLDDHTNSSTGSVEYLRTEVYAHGFGGTWVICDMSQGTRLINVHY